MNKMSMKQLIVLATTISIMLLQQGYAAVSVFEAKENGAVVENDEGDDSPSLKDLINDGPREVKALQYDIIERLYATPRLLERMAHDHFSFVMGELEYEGLTPSVEEIKEVVNELLEDSIKNSSASRLKNTRKAVFRILCKVIDNVFSAGEGDSTVDLAVDLAACSLSGESQSAASPLDSSLSAKKKRRRKKRRKKDASCVVVVPVIDGEVDESESDGEEVLTHEQAWAKIVRLWREIEEHKRSL